MGYAKNLEWLKPINASLQRQVRPSVPKRPRLRDSKDLYQLGISLMQEATNEDDSRLRSAIQYRDGLITGSGGTELDDVIATALEDYDETMRDHRLHDGLAAAMSIVRSANAFIDSEQPWKLARDDTAAERLDEVLAALVRGLATTAVMLCPFMPGKAQEMWHRLGGDELPSLQELAESVPSLVPDRWDSVLFPRVERTGDDG